MLLFIFFEVNAVNLFRIYLYYYIKYKTDFTPLHKTIYTHRLCDCLFTKKKLLLSSRNWFLINQFTCKWLKAGHAISHQIQHSSSSSNSSLIKLLSAEEEGRGCASATLRQRVPEPPDFSFANVGIIAEAERDRSETPVEFIDVSRLIESFATRMLYIINFSCRN